MVDDDDYLMIDDDAADTVAPWVYWTVFLGIPLAFCVIYQIPPYCQRLRDRRTARHGSRNEYQWYQRNRQTDMFSHDEREEAHALPLQQTTMTVNERWPSTRMTAANTQLRWEPVTMTLKADHFSIDLPVAHGEHTMSVYLEDGVNSDALDDIAMIQIPAAGNFLLGRVRPNRLASATCAICLVQYEVGVDVSWSSNTACEHVFHVACIKQWLSQSDEKKCPCCRRFFVMGRDDGLHGVQVALSRESQPGTTSSMWHVQEGGVHADEPEAPIGPSHPSEDESPASGFVIDESIFNAMNDAIYELLGTVRNPGQR
ncbi:hypothetical protein MPSEU_000659500 [Mayamaea pseudoterrestris]|nr:hypothetical protein MPSEU_000659500 [Mayamaea pseudoterrestris]